MAYILSMTQTAKVLEHRMAGMKVEMPDGSRAWLPYREISYEADFDPRNVEPLKAQFPVGKAVEVIVIDRTVSEKGSIVSVAAAKDDPWQNKVPEWLKKKAPKIMEVRDIGHPLYYYGQIMPGVEARIGRIDFKSVLGERANDAFFEPMPGDRLAGIVKDADVDSRVVTLSSAELFRPSLDDGSHGRLMRPLDAMAILTGSPELNLGIPVKEQDPDMAGGSSISSVPPFKRILVLDDEKGVAGSLAEFLRAQGFQVDECTKIAEARRCFESVVGAFEVAEPGIEETTVDTQIQPIDAALIDINLQKDPEDGNLAGIRFALEIQKDHPECRILLITGEELSDAVLRQKAEAAKGLRLAAFIAKPVGGQELLNYLAHARNVETRDGYDVFTGLLAVVGACETPPTNREEEEPPYDPLERKLDVILHDLAKDLMRADSVFLFSMHPVTYEVNVVKQWGKGLGNWERFHTKLRYSPVGDVCLDPRKEFETWHDPDAQHVSKFGRHRYLLYCYSDRDSNCPRCRTHGYIGCTEHQYHSCGAARVPCGPGDPLAYALFAMARERAAFDHRTVCLHLQLAAERIGFALRDARQQAADEENFPFLMNGRAACSVGHDLSNTLQYAINLETAESIVDRIRTSGAQPQDVAELQALIRTAAVQLSFALGVAKSFRDLAKDRDEEISEHFIQGILEGPTGAKKAAHPEVERNSVGFFDYREEERPLLTKTIRVRKNATVRVFQNLFNNSAQQVGLRGILEGMISIRLAFEQVDTRHGKVEPVIRIDVVDTGPGLHWRDRERIFEPRFGTRPDGSGMGLYIVKQEVHKVQGSVEVLESVLALGTCMRIRLPLAEHDVSEAKGERNA